MVGHLAFVGYTVGVTVAAFRLGERLETTGLAFGGSDAVIVPLVLGGVALVFGAAVWLAGTLSTMIDRFAGPVGSSSTPAADDRFRQSRPVARLALALLVVTALVTTTGVVRMNEFHPMHTEPEPLPDDPDELYATAFENTDRTSHEFRWVNATDEADEQQFEFRVDRTDQQLVFSLEGNDQYFTNGVFYHGESLPLPGYARMTEDELPRLGESSREADNWTVAADDGDEITLELTDPDDVFTALTGDDLETFAADPAVHESRARVTVDAECGTLSAGEFRLNVTNRESPDREYDAHVAYEYEIGTDVERPAELGSPGISEYAWRLFAY